MKKRKVTIVDYNAGNILSVSRAFEACGVEVELTNDQKKITQASFLVLPGDGSFNYATKKLKELEIFQTIKDFCKKGNPMLGICLGMQLLHSSSEEFGDNEGLCLIKGKIIRITDQNNFKCKVPIIGWHSVLKNNFYEKRFKKIEKIFDKKKFYFVHSYSAIPQNKNDLLGYFKFGNLKITAIVGRENILGCQFHPEKSGQNGLSLIKKFLTL